MTVVNVLWFLFKFRPHELTNADLLLAICDQYQQKLFFHILPSINENHTCWTYDVQAAIFMKAAKDGDLKQVRASIAAMNPAERKLAVNCTDKVRNHLLSRPL